MTMNRRTFLKGSLAGGVLAVAAGAGLLKPTRALAAAAWPKPAFEAKSTDDVVKNLYAGMSAAQSKDIQIKAPLQAENGAVVPVTVTTSLPTESIAVTVKGNDQPLAMSVDLSGGATGYLKTRIKMAKTSDVTAYVKSGGKLFMATQNVKVTVGGCGG